MTLTATPVEVIDLDAAATILVNGWAHHLRHGQTARFVAALIENAGAYEPRLGLHFDSCDGPNCVLLVDDNARNDDGRLYCSDDCEDDAAEAAFEQWETRRDHDALPHDASDDGRWAA